MPRAAWGSGGGDDDVAQFAAQLSEKSDGMFLYAKLVLDGWTGRTRRRNGAAR